MQLSPWWRAPGRGGCALAALTAGVVAFAGCASPGPPHSPSLGLPDLVSDLTATRSGNLVLLHFAVPSRTSDGQPLRVAAVTGTLCRQAGAGEPCVAVDGPQTRSALPVAPGSAAITWTDELPPGLLAGAPRPIAYRVELRNRAGRSAGLSDAVYAAAGSPPPPVEALAADPARSGITLHWTPAPEAGEVLLTRTDLRAGSSRGTETNARRHTGTPGVVTLQAAPGNPSTAGTIDRDITEGTTYRYSAMRRETVKVGGRTLMLESAPSAEVTATWRDVYPPAMPTGLTGLGYRSALRGGGEGRPGPYAVDLVWQPVNDPRLAGYLVYRQTLPRSGQPAGAHIRLTPEPLPTPGYHDLAALPGERYRYGVSAVDAKGNESAAGETIVDPIEPAVP